MGGLTVVKVLVNRGWRVEVALNSGKGVYIEPGET